MTLSHLRTHIRCTASEMRIWRSLVAPFCLSTVHSLPSLPSWLPSCASMHAHPRMIPMVMFGHRILSCGHSFFASSHTMVTGGSLHVSMMWLMFSNVPQVLHSPLLSKTWMLDHLSPIIGVLCIALKRNCWTLRRMVHFLRLLQIVSSVSQFLV